MKRYDVSLAVAVVLAFGGLVLPVPANAVPPTVTPTPGYDARLQEQHDAARPSPSAAPARPVHRRRVRRGHHPAD
jgi:hypothetical protein